MNWLPTRRILEAARRAGSRVRLRNGAKRRLL